MKGGTFRTLKSLKARWSAIDFLHWESDGELEGKNQLYEDTYSANKTPFICIKKNKLNSKLWPVSHIGKNQPLTWILLKVISTNGLPFKIKNL